MENGSADLRPRTLENPGVQVKRARFLSNSELAERTLTELQEMGVHTLIICPGARNSPWIELLNQEPSRFQFERFYHFDERAAGFFALGRTRMTRSPCAVLTTSGTAVGELLPACMEAYYCGAPLYFLTADRPKRFRGTGAPQSCEQNGIFGIYCQPTRDIDGELETLQSLDESNLEHTGTLKPVHWNVCFEDPRIPTRVESVQDSCTIGSSRFPLVIIGELAQNETKSVSTALKKWGYPIITEALSQLDHDPTLDDLRIHPHLNFWSEAHTNGYLIDGIIRIGGIPTLRFWRDLESHPEISQVPVYSICSLPFSGLPRAQLKQLSLNAIDPLTAPAGEFHEHSKARSWREQNRLQEQRKSFLLEKFSASEPGIFRTLSNFLPDDAFIYLGNSLPIREWDLASKKEPRFQSRKISANRGLNGIDGQLSTFFGMLSSESREHWAILGDLTTLYDLNAPWILREIEKNQRKQLHAAATWHLIIINNHGGRIFDRIFGSSDYLNVHEFHFETWAQQWGLSYRRLEGENLEQNLRLLRKSNTLPHVLEIVPDLEATTVFCNELEGLPR